MGMVNEIAEMIFENFTDDLMHTSQEYREKALEKGIINADNTTAISNTVFKIKDDPRFEVVDKGKYIVHKLKEDIDIMTVENAFSFLEKRIKKLQELNVLLCSEEEIQNGIEEKKIYIEYIDKFVKLLKI